MVIRALFGMGVTLVGLGALAIYMLSGPSKSRMALSLSEAASGTRFTQATPTPICACSWTLVSSAYVDGFDSYLLGMTAIAPNYAWAVGYYFNGFASLTLVEHWDGSQWIIAPSPNAATGNSILAGVAAISANDVWAVGYTSTRTLIEHWNGTQ